MQNIGKFSPEIEREIMTKGYHILDQALSSDSYPNPFPKYPVLNQIKIGYRYTIRLFIKIKSAVPAKIDSGLIDVKIISKSEDNYVGEIQTIIPDDFPLSKGQHIILKKSEILFEQVQYN